MRAHIREPASNKALRRPIRSHEDSRLLPLSQVSLEHFLWLADGYANPEHAVFYLQKHPMHKWAAQGLQAELRPMPHERIAPFLRLNNELLWLSLQVLQSPGTLRTDARSRCALGSATIRGRPTRSALLDLCTLTRTRTCTPSCAVSSGLSSFTRHTGLSCTTALA
eukprot:2507444-Prymnesium_polylepis.2